jgi:DNA segregation ATPase FtsK/SpoIIIE, S-DNA-T family
LLTRDPYRQYRRSMRRNRRMRHGGYPVILPYPYEPVAAMAFAAAARFAFRHRSAFWPFAITGTTFILAAIIHAQHPGYWVVSVVVTAAAGMFLGIPHRLLWQHPAGTITAGLLMRAWEACGIDRTAERVYVTAVAVTAGGWLSAAIAAGPAAGPLPALAGIATVVLGIPWWAHRRRRAKVRIERTIRAWPDLAENMGLPGSRIASATGDAWGFTARVILRKGTTAVQAINQVPAIESGLGIRPGSVRAIPDPDRADRVILRVIETDPHATAIPWPGQPPASITRPVELGLLEDGRTVKALILRRNVLIGGTTGAGKSGIVNVILAFLAACADVTIWGVDLKGGMELQPWARCLARIAVTPRETAALFRDATTELDRRAGIMAAKGARAWQPAPDDPALVIIVDEYAEMPGEAQEHADSVARRGRAVAVSLLAATQRPTQEAMGGNAVRSQMDVRLCLRVRERRDVDLILGQGSLAAGWHAHTLTQPGEFLISAPELTVPERARGYLITDEQVASQAARYARPAPAPVGGAGPPGSAQTAEPRAPGEPVGDVAPAAAEDAHRALWAALCNAPDGGFPVSVLIRASGKSRSWVYGRLAELADQGRAVQVRYGSWRAAGPPAGHGR